MSAIDATRDGDWLTVWFSQPERRNPMTDAMMAQMRDVMAEVRADGTLRGLTLRGRGGVFCAGGDLKSFGTARSYVDTVEMSAGIGRFLAEFDALPVVTIALVEGAAIAGGLGLMCCADVAVVAADAKFALTETRLGISPAQIAPYVLRRAGYANGRRLMLTGARFDGRRAVELGLADETRADVAGLEAVEAQIRADVLKCAPEAVAATKRLIRDLPGLDTEGAIAAAAENFATRLRSEEAQARIAAFFDKRK